MKKYVYLLLFSTFFFLNFSNSQAFSDVDANHQYYHAIHYLEESGIIEGYQDGTFQPDKSISRAELLKIGLLSNGHTVGDSGSGAVFLDTKTDAWFHSFLSYAKQKAIINGYPDGTFRPNNQVNAVEAMKMLVEMGPLSVSSYKTDGEEWFMPYIHLLDEYQIRKNFLEDFGKTLNRGEVAELMFRLISISHYKNLHETDLTYIINNDTHFENFLSYVKQKGYTHIVRATQNASDNRTNVLYWLAPQSQKKAYILQYYDNSHKEDFFLLIEFYEENGASWLHLSDAKTAYRMQLPHPPQKTSGDNTLPKFIPQAYSPRLQFSLEPYSASYNDALSTFSRNTDEIYFGIDAIVKAFYSQQTEHYTCKNNTVLHEGCISTYLLQNVDFWNAFSPSSRPKYDSVVSFVRFKDNKILFTIQNLGTRSQNKYTISYEVFDSISKQSFIKSTQIFETKIPKIQSEIIESPLSQSLSNGLYEVSITLTAENDENVFNNHQSFLVKKDNKTNIFLNGHDVCYECRWDYKVETDKDKIVNHYEKQLGYINKEDNPDLFYQAELLYILGKLKEQKSYVCNAADIYIQVLPLFNDSRLLNEILFMMHDDGCGISKSKYLNRVISKSHGWRKKIYESISNHTVFQKVEKVKIQTVPPKSQNIKKIILGNSYIDLKKIKKIGIQSERTIRDWLSYAISNYPETMVESGAILNYHEGARLRNILEHNPRIKVIPLVGTIVMHHEGKWYAPDENGIFRFEVLEGKVTYPTNKCYKNICLLYDTHGVASIVAQAVENDVDLVIGCGDHHGKTEASYYLAQKGIHVYTPPDRFVAEWLFHDAKGVMLGTAPVKKGRIGDQPITIEVDETIVAQDINQPYPAQYYDAPSRYFEELSKYVPLKIVDVKVEDLSETHKVVKKAKEINARVIGVRVWDEEDYEAVTDWLDENEKNRAVLFHTSPYKYSQPLFEEYPKQTSFGDPHPEFE